jgi:anthranilate phosphoribosyltransferase
MAEVLRLLGAHHAIIVHSDDGMDELSLGGDTTGWEVLDDDIRPYHVRPRELGLPHATPDDLAGGNPEQNADTMRRLLAGETGPIRDAVVLNAGAALVAGDVVQTLADGIEMAAAAIANGNAEQKLHALIQMTQSLAD